MNFKKNIVAAAAVVCAVSAVSCGKKVEGDGSSVVLNISTTSSVSTEAVSSTEASTEKTTEASSEKTTESSAETTAVATTVKTEAATSAAPVETTAAVPPVTEPPKPQGFAFDISVLGKDADPYVTKLGTPIDVQTAPGCLSNGADQKVYIFDGVVLSCYIQDSTEYIYDITITSNKYTTSMNGLTVGNSRADFEAAYGKGEESGNYAVYSYGNTEMSIQYSGDTAVSVIYYMYVQ